MKDWSNADFIASRTIGYEDLKKNVADYSPEAMAPICGVDARPSRSRPLCSRQAKAR